MTAPMSGRKMRPRFAERLLTHEAEVEALPEVARAVRVPGTPFAFLAFLVSRHYRARLAAFVFFAGLSTAIEAMSPYVLKGIIDTLTKAAAAGTQEWGPVVLYLVLFATVWYVPAKFS